MRANTRCNELDRLLGLPLGAVLQLATTTVVALLWAGTVQAAGETWTVCADGCEFTRIQQAVDFAEDGDVVRVEDPVHTEAGIIVDRVVAIEGLGREDTVVQGAEAPGETSEPVFAVRKNGATVRDMTIRNGGIGLSVFDRHYKPRWVFERLNLVDLGTGVRVDTGAAWWVEVRDSRLRDLGSAVSVRSGIRCPGWLTLARSTVTNSGGIAGPQRTTLTESSFHGNRRGISTVTLYLNNSTISGNRQWGPLLNATVLWLVQSTITDNVVDGAFGSRTRAVVMDHSILAGNRARRSGCDDESCEEALDCPVSSGFELFSRGYNLFGSDGTCFSDHDDDAFVDSEAVFTTLLGPLGNNGGPTPTHAPLAGGRAIDGGATTCAETDQRGLPRPFDGDGDDEARCDVGAVESLPANMLQNPGGIPGDVGSASSENN